MSERPATRNEILFAGGVASAFGLYFAAVGTGLLPIPGGPKNLHAPLWIVFCAGLVFLLAGIAVLMQGFGRTGHNGELPPGAPYWQRVFQYLMGLTIFVCFGMIASWIAFVPGERAFSASVMGLEGPANPITGRIAFGIGAVIIWLSTIAVAVSGARKLKGRRADS